ncbi:hypothetical protein F5B22DRAFT_344848 [Xylaria bambusicola]|uniref:uncharacterized protein n=1 Tax=Xylaria bambusicola TaxID=326684 RepID=UPI0020084AF2|nr:uncharacterized protein F5B22DRAFT_344848 [Xylaria bambusicola]KAI0525508.1 hypothetical protein F5B22DRAFT_344848 [Xylaria bambusicola]
MATVSKHDTIYLEAIRRRIPRLPDEERQLYLDGPSRHFYDTEDLKSLTPKGFPSMAVGQTYAPNTATFRTFENLDWKLLHFYETKITFLENRLYDLDVAEDRMMGGSQRGRLPFNKETFMDCNFTGSDPPSIPEALGTNGYVSQDEFTDTRERIFTNIEFLRKKHRELICWIEKCKRFPRVGKEAYQQLFTMAREYHGLDNEALVHLRAIDEMAYVGIDPIELWIRNVQLAANPLIEKIIPWLPTKKVLPEHDSSQEYDGIGTHGFKVLRKALVVLFGLSSVLVPAGLLYLGELSKALAFGVVAGFGALFALGTILVEQRIGHMVVIIVAYLAVLATFLSNMPQN